MRKIIFCFVGLAILSAIGAWIVSNYTNNSRGVSKPDINLAASSPEKNIIVVKSSVVTTKHDHDDQSKTSDDTGIESISTKVAQDLAKEANDILHQKELPVPPTVEEVTTKRLENIDLPQTIHGRLVDVEKIEKMLQPDDKPLRIYARASDGRDASSSAVIQGKFSFGQLPKGAYRIFLAERDQMPGLVMDANVDQNQQAQEMNIGLGECELTVTVLDENGNKMQSDAAELFLGGTNDRMHMFKRAKKIQDGRWRIQGLLSGEYIASAKIANSNGGTMLTLNPGINACTIQINNQTASRK